MSDSKKRLVTMPNTNEQVDFDVLLARAKKNEELSFDEVAALYHGMRKFRRKAIGSSSKWKIVANKLPDQSVILPQMISIYVDGTPVECTDFGFEVSGPGGPSSIVIRFLVSDLEIVTKETNSIEAAQEEGKQLQREFGVDLSQYFIGGESLLVEKKQVM